MFPGVRIQQEFKGHRNIVTESNLGPLARVQESQTTDPGLW